MKTFALVDAAFGQRRKMLRSALSGLLGTESSAIIESAGIDPTIRGEALVLEDYIRIAEKY